MTTSVEAYLANSKDYWGTWKFHSSALAENVKKVHFCAHPNRENQGDDDQPPTNHWSLFLEIDSTNSVGIDMVPGDPFTNSPGVTILEVTKDFSATGDYVYDAVYEVPPETTVASILQLIIDHRRDRYRFDPIGEGCRFWHSTVAMDMAAAGLLSYDAANQACSAIGQYWFFPPNSGSELRAMKKGIFL